MNRWGWLFCAPMILLMVVDPVTFIPAMLFIVIWIAVWFFILSKILGKKDGKE